MPVDYQDACVRRLQCKNDLTKNFCLCRVPTELKKRIQSARLEKKLTQAQLGQLINEKPNVSTHLLPAPCIPMCPGGCSRTCIALHACIMLQLGVSSIDIHHTSAVLYTPEQFCHSCLLLSMYSCCVLPQMQVSWYCKPDQSHLFLALAMLNT